MFSNDSFDQAKTKLSELQSDKNLDVATVGGGCFWCLEAPFEHLEGVKGVVAGYTGGKSSDPTYSQVSTGRSGHREVVQVFFDPQIVSYEQVLDLFWLQIDPTDPGGQFGDRGEQYQTAIYYHSEAQKKIAEESKKKLDDSGKYPSRIETDILPFTVFYPAEDYHQSYYFTHPDEYFRYAKLSGRKDYVEEMKDK